MQGRRMLPPFEMLREIEWQMTKWVKLTIDFFWQKLGEEKMAVFSEPIECYGDYGHIHAIAFVQFPNGNRIMMAKCDNGWCDKPVQPYFASFDYIHDMYFELFSVRGQRCTLEDNPLKGSYKDLIICV